jgi:hypothetical protein
MISQGHLNPVQFVGKEPLSGTSTCRRVVSVFMNPSQEAEKLKGVPLARTLILWHGNRRSLDGLYTLRPVLEAFAREEPVELAVLTDGRAQTERWGPLRVHRAAWSQEALADLAAQARLSVVPARPALADSYLKSAGRVRRLFAAGCPAIGDSRVQDVVEFGRACGAPVAKTGDEWLAAIRKLWHEPERLDEVARRGNALVRERYSTCRTAAQWIWFFSTQE